MSSSVESSVVELPKNTQKQAYEEAFNPTDVYISELANSYRRMIDLEDSIYDHRPNHNHIGIFGLPLVEQGYVDERARFRMLLDGFKTREALEFGLLQADVPYMSDILEEYDKRNPSEKKNNNNHDEDDSDGFCMGVYFGIIPATTRTFDSVRYLGFASRIEDIPVPERLEMLRVGADV